MRLFIYSSLEASSIVKCFEIITKKRRTNIRAEPNISLNSARNCALKDARSYNVHISLHPSLIFENAKIPFEKEGNKQGAENIVTRRCN